MSRVGKLAAGCAFAAVAVTIGVSGGTAHASARPSAVTCIAPVTGPLGGTGPVGATGPTGLKGAAGAGVPRSAHVEGLSAPNCVDLVGVCLSDQQGGSVGPVGPTGPTGPTGDTGVRPIGGVPRSVHVRQVDPCAGVPAECQYGVRGQQGATGPVGATGVKGPQGDTGAAGNRRTVHARPAGEVYPVGGSVINLPNCNLPSTGNGSASALPYAVALVLIGSAVVVLAGRRRVLRRS